MKDGYKEEDIVEILNGNFYPHLRSKSPDVYKTENVIDLSTSASNSSTASSLCSYNGN